MELGVSREIEPILCKINSTSLEMLPIWARFGYLGAHTRVYVKLVNSENRNDAETKPRR